MADVDDTAVGTPLLRNAFQRKNHSPRPKTKASSPVGPRCCLSLVACCILYLHIAHGIANALHSAGGYRKSRNGRISWEPIQAERFGLEFLGQPIAKVSHPFYLATGSAVLGSAQTKS